MTEQDITTKCTEEETPKALPEIVRLKKSENGKLVVAMVPAGENVSATNATKLIRMLRDDGYGDWHQIGEGIKQCCDTLGKLTQPIEIPIAESLDGELSITVSNDALRAFVTLTPPQGGQPVQKHAVFKELANTGIKHGIIESVELVGAGEKILIAEGEPSIDGEDTKFENLIPDIRDKHPKINDDGSVNYHEIGAIVTVSPGDALMRKHPPTNGTNGVDIYGKVVLAKPGKDLSFAVKLSGAEIDEQDRDLLIASIGGQPEIIDYGMNVNPIIKVKNVDLTTGNIDIDGTITIQGDVLEGLKVYATGDIHVSGMVEGAVLQAGGNIVIQHGVIGRGELRTADGKPGPATAQLKCNGSIEAKFIENAIVEANGNITVRELVSHSDMTSLNEIIVGTKGSKKGHILGGVTKSTISVQSQIIGSQANLHTFIEVGSDPKRHEQIRKYEHDLALQESEYTKLTTLIGRLRENNDQKSKQTLARVFSTLKKTAEDIKNNKKQLAGLQMNFQLIDQAKVVVGKHSFPNTSITIGKSNTIVKDRTNAGVYLLDGKNIIFKQS